MKTAGCYARSTVSKNRMCVVNTSTGLLTSLQHILFRLRTGCCIGNIFVAGSVLFYTVVY